MSDKPDSVEEDTNPSLAIDLDGCCDESNLFFRTLCRCWPGKVFVITYRTDRSKAIADLARLGIRYDQLILVDSFEAKTQVVIDNDIPIYFDDQPEMLKNMPPDRSIMLVRNEGNFDFDDKRWMLSSATGKLL